MEAVWIGICHKHLTMGFGKSIWSCVSAVEGVRQKVERTATELRMECWPMAPSKKWAERSASVQVSSRRDCVLTLEVDVDDSRRERRAA